MIELNFLPQTDQKVSKQKYLLAMLKQVIVWFNLTVLIVGILLLWSKFFLERNLASWQEQSILVAQNRLSMADQVENLNKDIRDLNTIQEDYVVWSNVITEIAQLVPPGNRIDELRIDTNGNTFKLSGFSSTRNNLLQLEENLEESDLIGKDFKSPLSNLLSPRDIEFEFSGSFVLK